jgi:FkbM family methyltransferase
MWTDDMSGTEGPLMNAVPSLTSRVSSTLKHTSLYARLKNSCVQDLYWRVSNRRLIDVRRRQVEFYRDLLRGFRKGDLIFDVGANVGEKTDAFIRLGARVVAVEPDERSQEVLWAKFIKYRLSRKPVCIVGKAVSDKISVETMWIDSPGSALNTLSQKWVDTLQGNKERFDHTLDVLEFADERSVQTTTLEHLIAEFGLPFFVKVDVEGHELSVLRGLRRPVPYLSYEINLPEFRQEGLECLNLLRNLAPEGESNYASDINCGLALGRWVEPQELAHIISECDERCVEVFWHTPSLLENG